jgi:hypothetical protein
MTKEEMQKILDEMPAGVDVEEYIKKKNEPVVDVNIIKEEYGYIMNLMRDVHKRYSRDIKEYINVNVGEYWKEIDALLIDIRKKYKIHNDINVLDWMHEKIFK